MGAGPVRLEWRGELAWVTIDNPPVNATSAAVRGALERVVSEVAACEVRAVVLRCAGRTFVAGGDVTEFDAPPVKPDLPDLVQAIEDCPVPWIAAMHGSVFGGGLEIALACAWRVAVPGTRFALPEVNLGIVPGAGGTQRLPRVVGVPMALEMATSGEAVTADAFLSAGGLDAVLPNLEEATLDVFASDLGARPATVQSRPVECPDADWWAGRAREVERRAAGAAAPMENLKLVRLAARVPFVEGQPVERARHLALRVSAQSRALRHVFFAERSVARVPRSVEYRPGPVKDITIIGGGAFAEMLERSGREAGLAVQRLADCDALDASASGASADLCVLAGDAGSTTPRSAGTVLLARDLWRPAPQAFGLVALGLDLSSETDLAEISGDPETDGAGVASAFALARALRRLPVLVAPAEQGVALRLWAALGGHASRLVSQGAEPDQVNAAWAAFGATRGVISEAGVSTATPGSPVEAARIVDELLAVLVNAGALIREEGLVEGDAVVDVIAVHACGFPRWRGGPLHHGAETGLDGIARTLNEVIARATDAGPVARLLQDRRGRGSRAP